MKVIELFAGTECISNAFRKRGHECFTVDWDEQFCSSLHCDIGKMSLGDIPEDFRHADVVFAAFDCTTFSVAAISKHRRKNAITGNLDPISDYARQCDATDQHVLELIKEINPKVFIIENPRGGATQYGLDARHSALHNHNVPVRIFIYETDRLFLQC